MRIPVKLIKRVAIIGAVVYLLVNPGFRRIIKHEIEKRKIISEIERLKKENEILVSEIRLMEADKSYYTQVVCRELGMLKPGEVEYRITEKTESKK